MLICTIRSLVTMRPKFEDSSLLQEEGFYELPVEVSMVEAAATGDPKGFINKTIAEYLASCVIRTGIPANERLWSVEFSEWAQTYLNYPGGFLA